VIYVCIAQIADAEQQKCVTEIEQAIIRNIANKSEIPVCVNQYNFRLVRNFRPCVEKVDDSYSVYLLDEDGETLLEVWSCVDLGTTAIVLASFQKTVPLLGYYEVKMLHAYNPPVVGAMHRGEYVCYD